MLRLELAALMVRNQFQRLYQPHGILIIRYRGQAVADDLVKSAMNFIFIFILSFAVLSICLSAVGLDFITAVSGAATALATSARAWAPSSARRATSRPCRTPRNGCCRQACCWEDWSS